MAFKFYLIISFQVSAIISSEVIKGHKTVGAEVEGPYDLF